MQHIYIGLTPISKEKKGNTIGKWVSDLSRHFKNKIGDSSVQSHCESCSILFVIWHTLVKITNYNDKLWGTTTNLEYFIKKKKDQQKSQQWSKLTAFMYSQWE